MSLRIEAGGLYAADLNPPHGTESGEVRPVLVVQTNLLNEVGHASTVVLPCTTRLRGESLLRVLLPRRIAGHSVPVGETENPWGGQIGKCDRDAARSPQARHYVQGVD